MKQKLDPRRPTYLMSPPPRCWRAAGNAYSQIANNFRGGTNPRQAGEEWLCAADQLDTKANIVVMPCGKKPQMTFDKVFTADAGAYFKKVGAFLLSNHQAEHRAGESEYVGRFLSKKLRLRVIGPTQDKWEGSSCMRLSPLKTFAVLGYGVRAARKSCVEVAKLLDIPRRRVLRIQMREPHIHLDTLFASLRSRVPLVVVCRTAFAQPDDNGWDPDAAYKRLMELTDDEGSKLECVSSKDGEGYATNLREDPDGQVFAPNGLTAFYAKVLKDYGYKVHPLNLPRLFWDGGGAAACLTNDLTGAVEDGWVPPEQYLYGNVRKQIVEEVKTYPEKQIPWD